MYAVAVRGIVVALALSVLTGCPSKPEEQATPIPAATPAASGGGASGVPGGGRDSDALGPRAPGELGNEQPPK